MWACVCTLRPEPWLTAPGITINTWGTQAMLSEESTGKWGAFSQKNNNQASKSVKLHSVLFLRPEFKAAKPSPIHLPLQHSVCSSIWPVLRARSCCQPQVHLHIASEGLSPAASRPQARRDATLGGLCLTGPALRPVFPLPASPTQCSENTCRHFKYLPTPSLHWPWEAACSFSEGLAVLFMHWQTPWQWLRPQWWWKKLIHSLGRINFATVKRLGYS